MLLSVGQNETDATSDRIKYTKRFLVSQKRWPAGAWQLPKCYTTDENHHVIIDREHEPYVRMLIDEVLRTSSVQTSMIRANEAYPESAMFYNNVQRLIRNTMLYGEYQGVVDFVAEPFMTREEWDVLQSRIKRNVRPQDRTFYIFSGLLKCPECGCNMTATTSRKQYKHRCTIYKYYLCAYAKVQHRCSNKINVQEQNIEAQLFEYIKTSVADTIAKVEAIEHERKQKPKKKNNRADIEKQLEKLEDVYIESTTMTKEKYEKKKAAILAKLVEDEPEEKLPELADLEKVKAIFEGDIEETYRHLSLEEKREFWRNVLSTIYIKDSKVVGVDFLQ